MNKSYPIMEDKKLTVEILKTIPFEDTNEPLPDSNFIYKNIGLNDLVIKEQNSGSIINPLIGNKDLFLVLLFVGVLLLMLILVAIFGVIILNEIKDIKNRIPKSF